MGFEILVIVLVAIVVFEIAEHVVLPIVAAIITHRQPKATGAEGMVGKTGRVIAWSGSECRVRVAGESWRAASREPLQVGDEVVVRAVRGLTLDVAATDSSG